MTSTICAICQDSLNAATNSNIIHLPNCNHQFHANCALQYAFYKGAGACASNNDTNIICPLCKTEICEAIEPLITQASPHSNILVIENPRHDHIPAENLKTIYCICGMWCAFLIYVAVIKTWGCEC